MRFLLRCVLLTSLLVTGRSLEAAEPSQLQLLPETPELDKPLLVYRDEGVLEVKGTCTWLAFHNGQPMAPKEYVAKDGWLKIPSAQAGRYVFVLTCKPASANLPEGRWATNLELHARPESRIVPAPAPSAASKLNHNSTEVKAIAREMIADRIAFRLVTDSTSNGNGTSHSVKAELADALEEVARSAMVEGWDTSRIAKELKTRWKPIADRHQAAIRWELLENLLKEVSLSFGDTGIEENSVDAIFALITLARSLRDDIQPRRELLRQNPLREASVRIDGTNCVPTTPCCRGSR